MIFQGISVARNYPAPSTILAIKKVLLCDFAKNIAKVMSTWMSKVGQNSTAFKK